MAAQSQLGPNLAPTLTLTGVNQLWVADITSVRLHWELSYLVVILDAFSRRCIGWHVDRYLTTELTLAALQMALAARPIHPGLMHHSDRGVQYAAQTYIHLLAAHAIQISMS